MLGKNLTNEKEFKPQPLIVKNLANMAKRTPKSPVSQLSNILLHFLPAFFCAFVRWLFYKIGIVLCMLFSFLVLSHPTWGHQFVSVCDMPALRCVL